MISFTLITQSFEKPMSPLAQLNEYAQKNDMYMETEETRSGPDSAVRWRAKILLKSTDTDEEMFYALGPICRSKKRSKQKTADILLREIQTYEKQEKSSSSSDILSHSPYGSSNSPRRKRSKSQDGRVVVLYDCIRPALSYAAPSNARVYAYGNGVVPRMKHVHHVYQTNTVPDTNLLMMMSEIQELATDAKVVELVTTNPILASKEGERSLSFHLSLPCPFVIYTA